MNGLAKLLATGFGIGHIPFASGTFASAAALPVGFGLILIGWQALVVTTAVAVVIGVWACGRHAHGLQVVDPSECVLDEVAGQWIALTPIALYARPFDWIPYAIGFLFFRLFDVLKFWPMSAAETLPGGYGVMADDVLAGLLAAGVVYAAFAAGWV